MRWTKAISTQVRDWLPVGDPNQRSIAVDLAHAAHTLYVHLAGDRVLRGVAGVRVMGTATRGGVELLMCQYPGGGPHSRDLLSRSALRSDMVYSHAKMAVFTATLKCRILVFSSPKQPPKFQKPLSASTNTAGRQVMVHGLYTGFDTLTCASCRELALRTIQSRSFALSSLMIKICGLKTSPWGTSASALMRPSCGFEAAVLFLTVATELA